MEATGKYTAEQLASFYKFQIVPDADYLNRIQATHKSLPASIRFMITMKFEVRGYTFLFIFICRTGSAAVCTSMASAISAIKASGCWMLPATILSAKPISGSGLRLTRDSAFFLNVPD